LVRDAGGVKHIPGGYHGAGDVLVAEADESDGSFLNYQPYIAVVTNVEPDHLDHYGDEAAFEAAFDQFAARIRPGGYLVACADDAGSARLAAHYRAAGGKVITYGTATADDVTLTEWEALPDGGHAKLTGATLGGEPVELNLHVPGLHNLRNAAAAVITANLLQPGSAEAAAEAAGHFLGTGRRFEYRGTANGVRVFDDYAHHPTEIEALLAGARPVVGGGKLIVLFQPHLYSRTKNFAERFAAALNQADLAVVTGVYKAREDVDPTVDAHTIVDAAAPGSQHLEAIEDKIQAVARVVAAANPGDVILTVGAGDVTELGEVILADLAKKTGG
jgi:UDP-N-acetylmuramate--alanine ligase